MSRQYPRYAGKIRLNLRHPSQAPLCACCDETACGYADVQYSWFRSDDVAYPVCEEHRKLASRDLMAFLAALPAEQHTADQGKT